MPNSALTAAAGTHTRRGAMRAIALHLNTARVAALDIARADYLAANGRSVDYPLDGPVLPDCIIDDPVDDVLDQDPDEAAKILRRLSLISGGARQGDIIASDMDEPRHTHELEWVIIAPAIYDLITCHSIFDKGIAEIETILGPLRNSGLTPAPIDAVDLTFTSSAASSAISFDFINVEFLTFDIGDHRAFSATIALELILDTVSILS